MTTLLETVAMAIYKAHMSNVDNPKQRPVDWEMSVLKPQYRMLAHAAIKALREWESR